MVELKPEDMLEWLDQEIKRRYLTIHTTDPYTEIIIAIYNFISKHAQPPVENEYQKAYEFAVKLAKNNNGWISFEYGNARYTVGRVRGVGGGGYSSGAGYSHDETVKAWNTTHAQPPAQVVAFGAWNKLLEKLTPEEIATIKQHEEYAVSKARSVVPTDEELYELIKPLWQKTNPSRLAQELRAKLSTSIDSPKYPQWVLDYVPEYVWSLIDIAAQWGINETAASVRREALKDIRKMIEEAINGKT